LDGSATGAVKTASKQAIRLGEVEETMLIPLYARAVETRRKRPIIQDPKAVEMVEAIDWDFRRFGQKRRVAGCVLRCAMFDERVRDFLAQHPAGTVVEIGAGLSTRFERLDNGTVHWFDLDLPNVAALRRRFFDDSARGETLAGSIVDPGWIATVRESPGPYCFVAETVFVYLREQQVKAALAQIARSFPGARVILDTVPQRGVDHGNADHARLGFGARFAWACEDPKEIESWQIGVRLEESRHLGDVPGSLRARLPLPLRAAFWIVDMFPKIAESYRLNVFSVQSEA